MGTSSRVKTFKILSLVYISKEVFKIWTLILDFHDLKACGLCIKTSEWILSLAHTLPVGWPPARALECRYSRPPPQQRQQGLPGAFVVQRRVLTRRGFARKGACDAACPIVKDCVLEKVHVLLNFGRCSCIHSGRSKLDIFTTASRVNEGLFGAFAVQCRVVACGGSARKCARDAVCAVVKDCVYFGESSASECFEDVRWSIQARLRCML